MPNTVKQDVEEYLSRVYPSGPKPQRDDQITLAFHYAIMTAFNNLRIAATELPEGQVHEYLDRTMEECHQFISRYAARQLLEQLLRGTMHSPPEPEPYTPNSEGK